MTSTLHWGQEVRPGKQGGKEVSHPHGPWLQALGLGRNRNGEDTWAQEPGWEGAGKPAGGAVHVPLTQELPTRPDPPGALHTERCKGSGQAGQTAQAKKEEGLHTGT